MPTLPVKQAEILRKLDIEGLLGADLMVVGTHAFSAYEWAANGIFPAGNEQTQDFDLTWCRGHADIVDLRRDRRRKKDAQNPFQRFEKH